MDEKESKVIWLPEAVNSLQNIYNYIWEQSPLNAEKFLIQLIDFGEALGKFPSKYALCRHKKFQTKNFRCAVFKRNWVFIYKYDQMVKILAIIHAKSIS
jgi:plasmid stabilization system protein ParE